jgi:glycosyltransferase involved in cell wall biosynthesis
MNIAFVLSYLADHYGGPVAAVKGLGRALTNLGQSVSYWATTGGDNMAKSSLIEGGRVYKVNWPRSWYRSKDLFQNLSMEVSSWDVVELSEFWLYPIYAGSRAAKLARVPYVLRPAGSLQSWALNAHPLKRLKKAMYLRLLGNSIMRGAACIRAASAYEAENIRCLGYRGPITIIPNGLDVMQFDGIDKSEAEVCWPQLQDRPVVLFMSRLSPEKGLDLLIPAWDKLIRSPGHKDAILVIAGPDYRGYHRTVEAMIEKHGLGHHVLMTGMVRGRRKGALLHRADVFVLPSYSENFGIVVAEALACGTPVITTTGTPWQQLDRIDAGRWIVPREHELLDTLREMLCMSLLQRKMMGDRGTDLIRNNYTWSSVANRFLHLCQCITEGKPIPFQSVSDRPAAGEHTPGPVCRVHA